jgi:heptosyltransferase-2/heptosyltransferase-3
MSDRRSAVHSPRTADPDAPVVVRFAALGDVVLLTPLLQALAERHGRPVHLLSSGAWTPQLLAHDPAVGELRLVTSRRAPYWLTPTQWWARRWLEAHRGAVYLCDPDPFAARLVSRAGVPDGRVVRAWDHRPAQPIHWVDWWLNIAALDPPQHLGPQRPITTPAQPRLSVPPAWHDECEAWLRAQDLAGRPLVLVQPGNKKTHRRGRLATAYYDKHWPPEHWGAVIRGVLARRPDAALLVCGSPRESGLTQSLIDAAPPLPPGARVVNAAALGLPLSRLVALAARAHSMISIDTGPAHVAAAMDCPLVVLFGSAGWGLWKPRAPHSTVTALGCEAHSPGARVEDLSPEQVITAWAALPPRTVAKTYS